MTEGSFEGLEGLRIFTRAWRPAAKPRAVVVISHGFNSHSGEYFWVAEQLVADGYAVYALDHRGRGKSDGERFFVKKFSDYTGDLATFMAMVKAREPGLPIFLLGHSAGGVVATSYALDHQDAAGRPHLRELRLPGAGARLRARGAEGPRATWRRTRTC